MVCCSTTYDGRPLKYGFVSWFGSFTGVLSLFGIIYAFEQIPGLEENGWITDHWVVGSVAAFGAQSVLVYALPTSPASQPWNCVIGSILASFIGVSCRKIFVALQQHNCPVEPPKEDGFDCNSDAIRPDLLLLATALANSISIFAMHLTDSMHPPAGAFTYIAVNASGKIRSLGYFYLVLPVGIGCVWFVMWAWFINNWVNWMVDYPFCKKSEDTSKIDLNSDRMELTDTLHPANVTKNTENINSQDRTNIDQSRTKAVKPVNTSSALSIRKYPSGDGIGGWIRPLRQIQ